jgi:hypothetical protein
VFLLGNWKDYKELEDNLSMPELFAVLEAKQAEDYENKKFAAALKGVDLDKNNNAGQETWERIKAKALSKGKTNNPQDVTTLQGAAAKQAGFGIGRGLDYEAI